MPRTRWPGTERSDQGAVESKSAAAARAGASGGVGGHTCQLHHHKPTTAAGPAAAAVAPALAPSDGLLHVDIDLIDPSPYQPRNALPRGSARRAGRARFGPAELFNR